ncbi:AAA family ATPase [Mycolicibacterium peregrinum]|uniref:LuxR family transcriptional regulator n=1 Tax=Mycolicibacterium peregrinum TaxID=43304 RepID=A0A1A0W387_MYCPR|nr:LuxR family transcriptional regulator [Mycolicibacterium peregrinum]OBB90089.1 LuxR family transcriptional regulator [Mycolicibacterium peregrinum]
MWRKPFHDAGARVLIGRDAECRVLEDLVTGMRSGGRVLVLRGQRGVGKTELLNHLLERVGHYRSVRVTGVSLDMDLDFAGLQQLCRPLLGHLAGLPEDQRDALVVVLGLGSGAPPTEKLVQSAVLNLLTAACRDEPLVWVLDDAHWLDPATLAVLAAVARRLTTERAGLVFATRDLGVDVLSGLPERMIGPLSDEHARDLLGTVMMTRLDPRVSDRIIAETRGNPLALVSLPHDRAAAELAGALRRGDTPSGVKRIELDYVELIRALPETTRQLLLAAAAEPVGDAAVLGRVADRLGITADMLAPAVVARVIEIDSDVRFLHPLARSAAYHAADPSARREMHRVLAEVTDVEIDPDRRIWHIANAVTWPDDEVAAQLEVAAGHAHAQIGMAVAATFLERAAVLTSVPDLRCDRALAAARAKLDAGAFSDADTLLGMAGLAPMTGLQRARAARLSAQMEFAKRRSGDGAAASLSEIASRMSDAAVEFEHFDAEVSLETHLEALAAAMYAGRLGDIPAVARTAETARCGIERLSTGSGPVGTVLRGMTAQITGVPYAGEGLPAAVERLGAHRLDADSPASRWMVPALPLIQQSTAYELWDDGLVHRLSTAAVRRVRASDALALLPETLAYRAVVHMLAGELVAAEALLTEADSTFLSTRYYSPLRYHSLALDAWKGDPEDLDALKAGAEAASASGEGRVLGLARYATAVLCNGLGRYEEAFVAAQQAAEYEDLGLYGWYLVELIEAATRIGNIDAAQEACGRLTERLSVRDTDWALGTLAGARALVADDGDAEAHYREAIDRLGRTRIRVHLARAHLRYGEWLRRRKRRSAAKEQLTIAHDMFRTFGARAFADRAGRELIAKGERAGRRPVAGGDVLTAQEAQIARLAAAGLTNAAIGEQLFISTHTVEWHLRKVFAKLSVTSRRQLRGLSDSLAHQPSVSTRSRVSA